MGAWVQRTSITAACSALFLVDDTYLDAGLSQQQGRQQTDRACSHNQNFCVFLVHNIEVLVVHIGGHGPGHCLLRSFYFPMNGG